MPPSLRAYWGDLRLPKVLLKIEDMYSMDPPQVHRGLDRDTAGVLAVNRNGIHTLNVYTFWTPESDYTSLSFRKYESAFLAAMKARFERTNDPLFEVDDSEMQTLTSASPITTTTAHGWSTGQVVLIRRLGVGLYTYGSITVTGASTFTISSSHTILAGDLVFPVRRYWRSAQLAAVPICRMKMGIGDYYEPGAVTTFLTGGDAIVVGTPANLDS